ncbi:hypothetical protein [Aliikangiella maris]|uniref:Lipoprotein n=2 Tax=Aliikangiella maris TaxID=3162458 RepID=A0ABV2BYK7_9GAMM
MLISRSFIGKTIRILVAIAILNGCATTKNTSIEDYIGLYEIVNSECEVAPDGFNPCKNTLFFEILRGQFIGVKNDELAYVFWSGDPKIDSELQYTSHLIKNENLKRINKNRYFLDNDSESQEYLEFNGGRLIGYYVAYNSGDGYRHRTIHYKLKPVRRGNLPQVRLNYPGNE